MTVINNQFLGTGSPHFQAFPERVREAYVIDPNYARVAYLQQTKQEDLAKTGHSQRKLISCEYGLQIDAESAHGVIRDIQA